MFDEVLDHTVVRRGTVVPQMIWPPPNAADRKVYVKEAVLQMPIYFEDEVDGRPGLSLEAATAGRCDGLRRTQLSAPVGKESTTHIRIAVSSHFDDIAKVKR